MEKIKIEEIIETEGKLDFHKKQLEKGNYDSGIAIVRNAYEQKSKADKIVNESIFVLEEAISKEKRPEAKLALERDLSHLYSFSGKQPILHNIETKTKEKDEKVNPYWNFFMTSVLCAALYFVSSAYYTEFIKTPGIEKKLSEMKSQKQKAIDSVVFPNVNPDEIGHTPDKDIMELQEDYKKASAEKAEKPRIIKQENPKKVSAYELPARPSEELKKMESRMNAMNGHKNNMKIVLNNLGEKGNEGDECYEAFNFCYDAYKGTANFDEKKLYYQAAEKICAGNLDGADKILKNMAK